MEHLLALWLFQCAALAGHAPGCAASPGAAGSSEARALQQQLDDLFTQQRSGDAAAAFSFPHAATTTATAEDSRLTNSSAELAFMGGMDWLRLSGSMDRALTTMGDLCAGSVAEHRAHFRDHVCDSREGGDGGEGVDDGSEGHCGDEYEEVGEGEGEDMDEGERDNDDGDDDDEDDDEDADEDDDEDDDEEGEADASAAEDEGDDYEDEDAEKAEVGGDLDVKDGVGYGGESGLEDELDEGGGSRRLRRLRRRRSRRRRSFDDDDADLVLEPATPRDAQRLSWAVEHRPPCTAWWRVREGYNIIRSARQYLDRILRNSSLACEAHPLPLLDGKGRNIVDDHHARSRAARWELPSGINPQRRYGLELELVADHDVAATAAAAAAAAQQQQAAARKQQAARLASPLHPPLLTPQNEATHGDGAGDGDGGAAVGDFPHRPQEQRKHANRPNKNTTMPPPLPPPLGEWQAIEEHLSPMLRRWVRGDDGKSPRRQHALATVRSSYVRRVVAIGFSDYVRQCWEDRHASLEGVRAGGMDTGDEVIIKKSPISTRQDSGSTNGADGATSFSSSSSSSSLLSSFPSPSPSPAHRSRKADESMRRALHTWHFTSDPSLHLTHAYEVTTPIMVTGAGLGEIAAGVRALVDMGTNKRGEVFGAMHVHIDNGKHGAGFTRKQRKRIFLAYAAFECGIGRYMHPSYMQRMASCWSRRIVQFPEFDELVGDLQARRVDIPAKHKECGPRGEWSAKDWTLRGCTKMFGLYPATKHNTLEFRAAAGTANFEYVVNWLQFTLGFVEHFKSDTAFDGKTGADIRAMCEASERRPFVVASMLARLVDGAFIHAAVRDYFLRSGIEQYGPVDRDRINNTLCKGVHPSTFQIATTSATADEVGGRGRNRSSSDAEGNGSWWLEDGGRGRNRSSSDAASNGSWWLEGGSFPGVDDAAAGAQHEALEAHGVTDVPD